MSPQEFDAVLGRTLADRRLTGSERRALHDILADARLDEAKRAVLRNRVFELARQALLDDDAKKVLAWTEDVLKLLLPPAAATAAPQAEAYFSPFDDCVGRIVRLFNDTQATADVCVFTITDDRIASAMLAAHARGVRQRVLTDNEKAFDLGSDIARLQAAGVAVRVDQTPFHMHHKYAIFDGRRLLNGSYNWTRGASRDNEENIIITQDPALLSVFAAAFDKLWQHLA
jgi:cardiolipin hydrolase